MSIIETCFLGARAPLELVHVKNKKKERQAEAEVVPSSSLVQFRIESDVCVGRHKQRNLVKYRKFIT